MKAFFAPTNIDTGLASVTFQYRTLTPGGPASEWRNLETISGHYTHGLDGDTTRCVTFQPRPNEIGQHGFDIRAIVEDYNGNDTSSVVTLYADNTPPSGTGVAATTISFSGPCGDRCMFDNNNASIAATFLPDSISGEINVHEVWLTAVREDGLFYHNFGDMTRAENQWDFNFGGNLCEYWTSHGLDMGSYRFWVHFTDCADNLDSVAVTTQCNGTSTDLVSIDCYPNLPDHATLDVMTYQTWDCNFIDDRDIRMVSDSVLDGNTEVGNQTVTICGTLPVYQQYIHEVDLHIQSIGAGVPDTIVARYAWDTTWVTPNAHYCFSWDVSQFPSGYYKVWVLAIDAICREQSAAMADSFWVHVDNTAPVAYITQINGQTPNPNGPDMVEMWSGQDNPTILNAEWHDGLNPDDSTQANNQVQLWAKNRWHPNQNDSWQKVGTIPSPCNPHHIEWTGSFVCGDTLDLVVTIADQWGNGSITDTSLVVAAYTAGRSVDVYVGDHVPPFSELWSVGPNPSPVDPSTVVIDQQTHSVSISGNAHDVFLTAFSGLGDSSASRVFFQYSLDGATWFDIGTADQPSVPPSCEEMNPPQPWWCQYSGTAPIMWSMHWDISGLHGNVWVKTWGEDRCGNIEAQHLYLVTIDVQAPMAQVFAWRSDINVDNVPCVQWTEAQIPDSLERYTTLTLGACPDTANYDAYGTIWFVKRADNHPLSPTSWCRLGSDSTGPFSVRPINMWDGNRSFNCFEPEVGAWYDIAVLTTDRLGNELTWTQFINHGVGVTFEQKWQDLINRGYVKHVKIIDHTAPMAHALTATPDMTPDSSVVFLTGNVTLSAMVDDPDVHALTFAVREQGSNGPWTVIERVTGDSGTFQPATSHWNTELLNGTYWIGAFAEDNYGNIDGDLSGVGAGPMHPLLVNIDNQRPNATITSVSRNGQPVTQLERGSVHTFLLNATDNFGIRNVALYYRASGGHPEDWTLIGTDTNWPYSFDWQVPPTLVVGWNYDFAAVATDLVNLNDLTDGQGQYVIDGTFQVVDNEANISLFTIGGVDAETTPHVNGTNVELVAHSEPTLSNVRYVWVRGTDTTTIGTVTGAPGQTTWTLGGWDVTTIAEGPAQVGAIGSADVGGNLVTIAQDFRNIVIDHSVPLALGGNEPLSHGLIGGECEFVNSPVTDDLWVRFNFPATDAGIDTVWFQWKWAADPNDSVYWHDIAMAINDNGLTGNWAYAWDATGLQCGAISLRAKVSDNAVPASNIGYVLFADSVAVDNCAPTTNITNINGDVTPENTQIAQGQVATIVATVVDPQSNGGNSSVDSVAFYYRAFVGEGEGPWIFIGSDANGAPWETMWNTGGVDFGNYEVRAVAWDHAGNCGVDVKDISIVDQLYQRAYIVGWQSVPGLGCQDKMWAVTDDCPTNNTTRVMFQYSTDDGQNWVSLGEDQSGTPYCDHSLDYNVWEIDAQFDAIPQNAIFRAVATDESNNDDPNPPVFQFADVSASQTPVIFNQDWVQVSTADGQVPWVFGMLEDYSQSPCFSNGALVCVNQVNGDPTSYGGTLDPSTQPCQLNHRNGKVTVFSSVPVIRGNRTYMVMTKYEENIYEISAQGGSNGWLTSEDQQMQAFVPIDGVTGDGTGWFQPARDDQVVNMLPPSQYYYTMISRVEYLMSKDLSAGQHETRFRMHFDQTRLPANPEDWQVVATYYDASDDLWLESGIIYQTRDFQNGMIEFYFPNGVPWMESDENPDQCPAKIAFTVMLTTVRPIDQWVRFSADPGDECPGVPDSTYYTPERGPTVDCDAVMWAVLRQGEEVPPENVIDVYVDGIRIVNDGVPDHHNHEWNEDLFRTSYDDVSGIYRVWFNEDAYSQPPWYGCFGQGQHNVQFFVNNVPTHLTPFYVDRTGPEAFTRPDYINHQVNLWADLTDAQSGIDTSEVWMVISDCTPGAFDFVLEGDGHIGNDSIGGRVHIVINQPQRVFMLSAQAMRFTPIANGYRANVTMQWENLQQWLIQNNNPGTVCVTWAVNNKICYGNDSTVYTYHVDVEPPMVVPVSPVGAGIDDDGDGLVNEDWRDCVNNDNDRWWSDSCGCWVDRIDEDPINFLPDSINCGERPTIEAYINDLAACGSGASGVDMANLSLVIDGHTYTIADTANHALNFHVMWRNGQDDAYFVFGGQPSGTAADIHYTPGEHRVTVAAPDSAGNVGSYQSSWTYYVRCGGPSVTYGSHGTCGNWFNPQGPNNFTFTVSETQGAPIAPNGIVWSAVALPSGQVISGPTTVDPAGQQNVTINYDPSGSFPEGSTGLDIRVIARNIFAVEGDTVNGYTRSNNTYYADNCAPVISSHTPLDGMVFGRDEAITVEAMFNDDCGTGANGSGVTTDSVSIIITAPGGTNIVVPANVVKDNSHVRYVIPAVPAHTSGQYTASVRVRDCVGNVTNLSWQFNVRSSGPEHLVRGRGVRQLVQPEWTKHLQLLGAQNR